MRKALGVVTATLATPIAIGVLFAVLTFLGVGGSADKGWKVVFMNIATFALLAAPIALVVSLLAGIPLGNRLARRGYVKPSAFLLLGAMLGAFPLLLFDGYVVAYDILRALRHGVTDSVWGIGPTLGHLLGDIPVAIRWLGLGSWCGAWSALAYWRVVYRGSPSHFGIQAAAADVAAPDAGR